MLKKRLLALLPWDYWPFSRISPAVLPVAGCVHIADEPRFMVSMGAFPLFCVAAASEPRCAVGMSDCAASLVASGASPRFIVEIGFEVC